ncbi:probable 28S ribosomal protein S25, mitochondrial [Lingula anatina]|uniref:Small ribosomal subunit protein mS25 n=1 Tax=Lingula anatina TaxID=7574 RepID=A0A1S3J9H5_LINAN|nr:probable 28S ribosomal protein S25, mitochondrial [Lingula anatina]|eukprot:XP_013407055.1 probable 28S ribosomal protein S25, mitochondrial [Lingula anatina]
MPFLKGRAAIRRSLNYLKSGNLRIRKGVRTMIIHYNVDEKNSTGLKQIVFWHIPQIRYQNPQVQIAIFKNMTPIPCIRCLIDDGSEMVIDTDSKTKDEIMAHMDLVIGIPQRERREFEERALRSNISPKFGFDCPRWCICEVPGQVPCPGYEPLPEHLTGKWRIKQAENDLD